MIIKKKKERKSYPTDTLNYWKGQYQKLQFLCKAILWLKSPLSQTCHIIAILEAWYVLLI